MLVLCMALSSYGSNYPELRSNKYLILSVKFDAIVNKKLKLLC